MTDRELYEKGFREAYEAKDIDVTLDSLRPYREGRLQGSVSRSFGQTPTEASKIMVQLGRRWK